MGKALTRPGRPKGNEHFPEEIAKVEMLGTRPVTFTRDASALMVDLPQAKPNDYAWVFKITPAHFACGPCAGSSRVAWGNEI